MKPHRAAIGNLIESMDFCDATRSHETMPSYRLRKRGFNWHGLIGWTLLSALVLFVLAAASSI